MRHGKKFNHLGRTASHRSAMLSNMASSLILHKRINTTVAKAKALRRYVEPLLTKSKDDTTHSRRVVFSYLQNKESVSELFSTVADKIANRPGGYTRIIKTGSRLGDNADMCVMELVDFNELMITESKPKKSRRSRRGGKGKKSDTPPVQEQKDATGEVSSETVETTPEEEVQETKANKETDTTEVEGTKEEEEPQAKAEGESEAIEEVEAKTEEVEAKTEEATESKESDKEESDKKDDSKKEDEGSDKK